MTRFLDFTDSLIREISESLDLTRAELEKLFYPRSKDRGGGRFVEQMLKHPNFINQGTKTMIESPLNLYSVTVDRPVYHKTYYVVASDLSEAEKLVERHENAGELKSGGVISVEHIGPATGEDSAFLHVMEPDHGGYILIRDLNAGLAAERDRLKRTNDELERARDSLAIRLNDVTTDRASILRERARLEDDREDLLNENGRLAEELERAVERLSRPLIKAPAAEDIKAGDYVVAYLGLDGSCRVEKVTTHGEAIDLAEKRGPTPWESALRERRKAAADMLTLKANGDIALVGEDHSSDYALVTIVIEWSEGAGGRKISSGTRKQKTLIRRSDVLFVTDTGPTRRIRFRTDRTFIDVEESLSVLRDLLTD